MPRSYLDKVRDDDDDNDNDGKSFQFPLRDNKQASKQLTDRRLDRWSRKAPRRRRRRTLFIPEILSEGKEE